MSCCGSSRRTALGALANDVHCGEQISGLIVGELRPAPALPRASALLLGDVGRGAGRSAPPDRGAQRPLRTDDLTAEASERDTRTVHAIDAWARSAGLPRGARNHVVLHDFSDPT
ncbi:hypothetical protein AB4305_10090 [Nocardia sp. 2YAB30]|uniref:hypothetical protein n=1 Tax=unclassified Nocardia TaxID=2637762 RepID=UPI003F9E16ED